MRGELKREREEEEGESGRREEREKRWREKEKYTRAFLRELLLCTLHSLSSLASLVRVRVPIMKKESSSSTLKFYYLCSPSARTHLHSRSLEIKKWYSFDYEYFSSSVSPLLEDFFCHPVK